MWLKIVDYDHLPLFSMVDRRLYDVDSDLDGTTPSLKTSVCLRLRYDFL